MRVLHARRRKKLLPKLGGIILNIPPDGLGIPRTPLNPLGIKILYNFNRCLIFYYEFFIIFDFLIENYGILIGINDKIQF